MVINAEDLDLTGVFVVVALVVLVVPALGLLITFAAVRFGPLEFGPGSVALGFVAAIAAVVDVVVGWRMLRGEVTAWDVVWAAGLTTTAVGVARLVSSRH